CARSGAMDYW
nr:immunoglobulin heavy chain junction region [Mus musculus]